MQDTIIADLRDTYGLACTQITPVAGGWLNRKWKVTAGERELLVKQFSNERCGREKLEFIESALQRQIILEKHGVPCPFIWQCGGRAIRLLDHETAYMVMDFRPGWAEGPGTVTLPQMRSLGSACGLMHKVFSQLPAEGVEGYPIHGQQVMDSLWANFHARRQECSTCGPVEYRMAVLAQEPILKQLSTGFFDRLPKGIAHEDFSPDNILFGADYVSAILDFDRNRYSFLWHDIGRAMLSLALKDNRMDLQRISAFVEGYSQYITLTLPDVADALRLAWCIEAPWWIRPERFRENTEKVVRFKDEMLWLTEHWFELDSLLCSRQQGSRLDS